MRMNLKKLAVVFSSVVAPFFMPPLADAQSVKQLQNIEKFIYSSQEQIHDLLKSISKADQTSCTSLYTLYDLVDSLRFEIPQNLRKEISDTLFSCFKKTGSMESSLLKMELSYASSECLSQVGKYYYHSLDDSGTRAQLRELVLNEDVDYAHRSEVLKSFFSTSISISILDEIASEKTLSQNNYDIFQLLSCNALNLEINEDYFSAYIFSTANDPWQNEFMLNFLDDKNRGIINSLSSACADSAVFFSDIYGLDYIAVKDSNGLSIYERPIQSKYVNELTMAFAEYLLANKDDALLQKNLLIIISNFLSEGKTRPNCIVSDSTTTRLIQISFELSQTNVPSYALACKVLYYGARLQEQNLKIFRDFLFSDAIRQDASGSLSILCAYAINYSDDFNKNCQGMMLNYLDNLDGSGNPPSKSYHTMVIPLLGAMQKEDLDPSSSQWVLKLDSMLGNMKSYSCPDAIFCLSLSYQSCVQKQFFLPSFAKSFNISKELLHKMIDVSPQWENGAVFQNYKDLMQAIDISDSLAKPDVIQKIFDATHITRFSQYPYDLLAHQYTSYSSKPGLPVLAAIIAKRNHNGANFFSFYANNKINLKDFDIRVFEPGYDTLLIPLFNSFFSRAYNGDISNNKINYGVVVGHGNQSNIFLNILPGSSNRYNPNDFSYRHYLAYNGDNKVQSVLSERIDLFDAELLDSLGAKYFYRSQWIFLSCLTGAQGQNGTEPIAKFFARHTHSLAYAPSKEISNIYLDITYDTSGNPQFSNVKYVPKGTEIFDFRDASSVANFFQLQNQFEVINYFQASSELFFRIASPGNLGIYVYNLQGKEVYQMSNAGFFEAGAHNLQLDLNALSSGAYIISLNSGKSSSTKLILKK